MLPCGVAKGATVGEFATTAISALEPLVGSMAASTCVRATALSLGKTADNLDGGDLAALEQNVRRLLGPVAPENIISEVLREIEGGLR
jgi:predicted ArsR family transcriptional regulator